jgi:hypothetical protein
MKLVLLVIIMMLDSKVLRLIHISVVCGMVVVKNACSSNQNCTLLGSLVGMTIQRNHTIDCHIAKDSKYSTG